MIDADSTADYILQAKFVEVEKQNLIKLEETEYHFSEVTKILHSSGSFYVYQPVLPSGVNASKQAYDWSTSDSTVATVSAYSSITINSTVILESKFIIRSEVKLSGARNKILVFF